MAEYIAILENHREDPQESWYYFIKKEGNEDALKNLERQFDEVDWTNVDDMSSFAIDLMHPVNETTARQMTKLDLTVYFPRKFDGTLQHINFEFEEKDDDEDRAAKIYAKIGNGCIDEYVSSEEYNSEGVNSEDEEPPKSMDAKYTPKALKKKK